MRLVQITGSLLPQAHFKNNFILFSEIIVGYEFTSYTTTETMGSVTLCAIIYNPPSGVAPRPFTISATTQDGTASMHNTGVLNCYFERAAFLL